MLLISHVALFLPFLEIQSCLWLVDPPSAHLGCGDAHMHRTPEVGQGTGWGSRRWGVVVVAVVVMVMVRAPHARPVHITTGPGLCCVPAAY